MNQTFFPAPADTRPESKWNSKCLVTWRDDDAVQLGGNMFPLHSCSCSPASDIHSDRCSLIMKLLSVESLLPPKATSYEENACLSRSRFVRLAFCFLSSSVALQKEKIMKKSLISGSRFHTWHMELRSLSREGSMRCQFFLIVCSQKPKKPHEVLLSRLKAEFVIHKTFLHKAQQ